MDPEQEQEVRFLDQKIVGDQSLSTLSKEELIIQNRRRDFKILLLEVNKERQSQRHQLQLGEVAASQRRWDNAVVAQLLAEIDRQKEKHEKEMVAVVQQRDRLEGSVCKLQEEVKMLQEKHRNEMAAEAQQREELERCVFKLHSQLNEEMKTLQEKHREEMAAEVQQRDELEGCIIKLLEDNSLLSEEMKTLKKESDSGRATFPEPVVVSSPDPPTAQIGQHTETGSSFERRFIARIRNLERKCQSLECQLEHHKDAKM